MDSSYRNRDQDLLDSDSGCMFNFPPDQLPKHKIFISHSGRQKDFAEQLCEDLERWGYYPFFDKRQHSLPKGENFPPLIFEATRECFLAILLLSEEFFTRSKWPMLELASVVKAQKTQARHMQILPVLLDLCIGDFKDTARWLEHWKNWEDKRVNCKEWETAVKSLRPVNMLMKSSFDGEVALRKEIVKAVLHMMPPDIQPDVAHVQGNDRLCKEIASKILNIPASCSKLCENAKVLGVYGIAGVGKSTLCMILTHFLRREFEGRVCHVELDEGVNTVKLQHRALKQLTGANQDYLSMHINTREEGFACLKERMPRQRVFLAVDNVSDSAKSVEAAEMFLKLKFHPDSVVLVTSRSRDVLGRSLGISESCIMLCPNITAQEAWNIMVNHINLPSIGALTEEQEKLLHQAVDHCNFGGFHHPLSLKVLASQMGSNPSSWRLGDLNLQEASDIEHPLFSAIETNFLRLPDQQTKDLFMDIALFCPESVDNVHDVCIWLNDTLHSNWDINHIKWKLHNLRLKSLLEVWSTDGDAVRIHDLHVELAIRKARVEDIVDGNPPRFVYQSGDKQPSRIISNRRHVKHIERAGFVESTFTTLSLEEWSYLELLCVRRCEKLATLSLDGLVSLVSLELSSCPVELLNLKGLVKLRWLCVDSCGKVEELDASGLKNLTCVCVSRCINLKDLLLGNSDMLESLTISYNSSLECVDLGCGQSLHSLTLWFCDILAQVHLNGSPHLSEFKKRGCPRLLNIEGCNNVSHDVRCLLINYWHKISSGVITALEGSKCLQVLDLWDCPASRLPDLRGCEILRELRLSDLDVLLDSDDTSLQDEYAEILGASSASLGLPASLQDLNIVSCRNVVVKEVCWKLQGLKNLAVLSMQRVRVAWDWELYTSIEQKGASVFSQACKEIREAEIVGEGRGTFEEIRKGACKEIREAEIVGGEGRGTFEEGSNGNVESSNEVLHTDIGIDRKAEMFSGGGKRSGAEEASNDNLQLPVERSREGPTMMDLEMFFQIMYWVQKHAKNASFLERELGERVLFYCEKSMGKPLMEVREDTGLRWERMVSTSDRIQKLQYGIVERTLLETCHSRDTIIGKCLYGACSKNYELINMGEKVAAEELARQLSALRAISPQGIVMCDSLETWEDEIIDEVATYERIQAFGKMEENMLWEHRLMEEGIALELPKVEAFEKRLRELYNPRMMPTMKQWRQDWLRSCKIGILIEQMIILEKRRLEGGGGMRRGDFDWLREMIRAVDSLLRSALNQLEYENEEWWEGMLGGWKMRQWLQTLTWCLSGCRCIFRRNRSVITEVLREFSWRTAANAFDMEMYHLNPCFQRPHFPLNETRILPFRENSWKRLKKFWLMKRDGKEPSSDQQPEVLKPSSDQQPEGMFPLRKWRKARMFPLRKEWTRINRDQQFLLPITHCSRLRHLHISGCRLEISP